MARVLYGSQVTQLRGSVLGTTFQQSAYGPTARGKPLQVTPLTVRQTRSKTDLVTATTTWRGLSPANRASYDAYASANPTPTRKDPNVYLNGYNLYVRYNSLRRLSGLATLPNTPSSPIPISVDGIELLLEEFTSTLTLGISFSQYTNHTFYGMAFLGPPQSPSRKASSRYTRFIRSVLLPDSTTTIDVSEQYLAAYNQLPNIGDYVSVDLTLLCASRAQILELPTTLLQVQSV